MPDFLRVNGVVVPVLAESADLRPEVFGAQGRAVDGSMYLQRTAIKRVYECSVPPQTAAVALALEGLLHGRGHVWPFSAALGLYSSRGALMTSTGGTVSRAAAIGKFGADSMLVPNGATARTGVFFPTVTGVEAATLSFWTSQDAGATWTHRVFRSAASQFYNNGVAGAGPSGLGISYSGAFGWQLANTTGGTLYVDDLWVCPYDWPVAWPAQVHAYNLPVGLTQRLRCDGLLIGNNTVTLDAFGEVTSLPLLPGVVGSYQANLHTVAFRLMEV